MAMDYYTAMTCIWALGGAVVLLMIWLFILMANKWIRTIFFTMLSGSSYVAMIHNNDNSVDIVKAIRGKDGIIELLNVPEKYGMKFSPEYNHVEKTNAFGTRLIHFCIDHNNTITPEDAIRIDRIRKEFESANVEFSRRNLTAFYYIMDKYKTDQEVLEHINLNYVSKNEEGEIESENKSRDFTLQTLNELREIKKKLVVYPYDFQRSKEFLDLLSETSSVKVQNVVQQHIEIERGLKGGLRSKIDNNLWMWIIIICIGGGILLMAWPYLQGYFGA